jgi:hypothetical protein
MTWTQLGGHKAPVKGIRASGPQGLDPFHFKAWTDLEKTLKPLVRTVCAWA